MIYYDEFPLSTVIYNWATAGGVVVLGALVAAQLGVWLLLGYGLLVLAALVGCLATVCTRCGSYYGRRCGLGVGLFVPWLFKQGRAELYMRTPMQSVSVSLYLLVMAWPVAGGIILLLVKGFDVWRPLGLAAAVLLLLAFALPHPRLVCSHCRQGECGACPVGRRMGKEDEQD